MNDAPAIAVDQLSFSYHEGAEPILEDVTWHVADRDFVALLGPNGGGKTTLLRLILGLEQPDHGTVRLFGHHPHRNRHRVGYVAQRDTIDTGTPHTALDVVLCGRLAANPWGFYYRRADRDVARAALDRVGLADYGERTLDRLSGGQRQRVRIARALCAEVKLLLLDEPLSGIDPDSSESLFGLLHELNRSRPIVLVSHDVTSVSRHVSHVACCNRRLMVHSIDELVHDHGAGDDVFHRVHHDPRRCPFTTEVPR